MGLVPNDQTTVGHFVIGNEGDAPLRLTKVKTSCGCTTGKVTEGAKSIMPGAEGKVEVTFYPDKVKGFSAKRQLTVWTNDPHKGTVSLDVLASVDPEFSLEPVAFEFGEVEKGEIPEATLILRQEAKEKIEIKEIEKKTKAEYYEVTFERRPESEWREPKKPEFAITAKLLPNVPTGPFYGTFDIKSTCKRVPSYRCTIHADVGSFYVVEPTMLAARVRAVPGDQQIATALVRGAGTEPPAKPKKGSERDAPAPPPPVPVEVADLSVSGDDLTVASRPGADPGTVRIDVSVKPTAKPGLLRETVAFTVKSGDRAVPHTMRVYATVRKERNQAAQ
ncbi:MAG: DUF1573 domain-containing protein [bacterium]|nr:DUF1573 domain-containing protein [bacterium]